MRVRREEEGKRRFKDTKQMNQKFLATIICIMQYQISMLYFQACFMTVYHHNVTQEEKEYQRRQCGC